MLNICGDAVPGKSLSGFNLGESLSDLLGLADTIIDGNEIDWTVSLVNSNSGVLFYKFKEGGGVMYFADPSLELNFNAEGLLCTIVAGDGYQGRIYNELSIGSKLGELDHFLYLDDTNDVHYLCDDNENILPGIYFIAEGEPVEEEPDQIITQVCVYDRSL